MKDKDEGPGQVEEVEGPSTLNRVSGVTSVVSTFRVPSSSQGTTLLGPNSTVTGTLPTFHGPFTRTST